MHPEIQAAVTVTSVYNQLPALEAVTTRNAEKVLHYIEDINLERKSKFLPTFTKSLYMQWNVEDCAIHMECGQNGRIFYSFCKPDAEPLAGNDTPDGFITTLQNFLLLHIS